METFAVISCFAASIGLLAFAYDSGKETPALVRWPGVGIAITFFAVGVATIHKPGSYSDNAAIGYTGLAVLSISMVAYLIVKKHISLVVIKTAGLCLFLTYLTWAVISIAHGPTKASTGQSAAPADSVRSTPTDQEKADTKRLENL